MTVIGQEQTHGLPSTIGKGVYPDMTEKIMLSGKEYRTTVHEVDDVREFVCGWGAALINITLTFPVNKIMFRQMLHGISSSTAISQLRKEGGKNLYRGVLPPLCQKTISTSLMFGMYNQCSILLKNMYPSISPGIQMATAATFAGCAEAILCPFERIQTLLLDKKFHGMYKNSIHVAQELKQFGPQEYYRGLSSVLIRNAPSNVLFFGLRTEIRDRLPSFGGTIWANVFADFVSGAFLGAFISTIMYPINVVKTHQQCQVGGPFISFVETYFDIYNARGRKFYALFKGVHINYTRAFLSWGIINASYEILHNILYQ